MRKMLITLALVAAPVLAAAQTPSQTPDSSKAKPKTTAHHAAKPKPKSAADTSKAKPKAAAPASTDTTKKPN
jgi:hypothetical protein